MASRARKKFVPLQCATVPLDNEEEEEEEEEHWDDDETQTLADDIMEEDEDVEADWLQSIGIEAPAKRDEPLDSATHQALNRAVSWQPRLPGKTKGTAVSSSSANPRRRTSQSMISPNQRPVISAKGDGSCPPRRKAAAAKADGVVIDLTLDDDNDDDDDAKNKKNNNAAVFPKVTMLATEAKPKGRVRSAEAFVVHRSDQLARNGSSVTTIDSVNMRITGKSFHKTARKEKTKRPKSSLLDAVPLSLLRPCRKRGFDHPHYGIFAWTSADLEPSLDPPAFVSWMAWIRETTESAYSRAREILGLEETAPPTDEPTAMERLYHRLPTMGSSVEDRMSKHYWRLQVYASVLRHQKNAAKDPASIRNVLGLVSRMKHRRQQDESWTDSSRNYEKESIEERKVSGAVTATPRDMLFMADSLANPVIDFDTICAVVGDDGGDMGSNDMDEESHHHQQRPLEATLRRSPSDDDGSQDRTCDCVQGKCPVENQDASLMEGLDFIVVGIDPETRCPSLYDRPAYIDPTRHPTRGLSSFVSFSDAKQRGYDERHVAVGVVPMDMEEYEPGKVELARWTPLLIDRFINRPLRATDKCEEPTLLAIRGLLLPPSNASIRHYLCVWATPLSGPVEFEPMNRQECRTIYDSRPCRQSMPKFRQESQDFWDRWYGVVGTRKPTRRPLIHNLPASYHCDKDDQDDDYFRIANEATARSRDQGGEAGSTAVAEDSKRPQRRDKKGRFYRKGKPPRRGTGNRIRVATPGSDLDEDNNNNSSMTSVLSRLVDPTVETSLYPSRYLVVAAAADGDNNDLKDDGSFMACWIHESVLMREGTRANERRHMVQRFNAAFRELVSTVLSTSWTLYVMPAVVSAYVEAFAKHRAKHGEEDEEQINDSVLALFDMPFNTLADADGDKDKDESLRGTETRFSSRHLRLDVAIASAYKVVSEVVSGHGLDPRQHLPALPEMLRPDFAPSPDKHVPRHPSVEPTMQEQMEATFALLSRHNSFSTPEQQVDLARASVSSLADMARACRERRCIGRLGMLWAQTCPSIFASSSSSKKHNGSTDRSHPLLSCLIDAEDDIRQRLRRVLNDHPMLPFIPGADVRHAHKTAEDARTLEPTERDRIRKEADAYIACPYDMMAVATASRWLEQKCHGS